MSYKLKKVFDSYNMPQELMLKLDDCYPMETHIEWEVYNLHNPISGWLVENGAEEGKEVLIKIH